MASENSAYRSQVHGLPGAWARFGYEHSKTSHFNTKTKFAQKTLRFNHDAKSLLVAEVGM